MGARNRLSDTEHATAGELVAGMEGETPFGRNEPRLSAAVLSALNQGNKIAAIKLLREERGLDLKSAKDDIDRYVREHPAMRRQFDAAREAAKRKGLAWLLVLGLLGLALYAFVAQP